MKITWRGDRARVVQVAYERERHRMDPAWRAERDADRAVERFHAAIHRI